MILQITTKEWILLQDALSGIGSRHTLDEVYQMKKKLDTVLNEQCSKEDKDDTK